MRCDHRWNCFVAECRCCGWRFGIVIEMPCCYRLGLTDCRRAAVLSAKGIVSLMSISRPPPFFLWRSSRSAAHPGIFSGLVMLISLVHWIAAMLTLLMWRKVYRSAILPLIPLAFHCISRRQLVGVGVETGPGIISISPSHVSRSRSNSECIGRYDTKKGDLTIGESQEALAIDIVGSWSGC